MDKPRSIEFKGLTDLVTDTDKAAEQAVLAVHSQHAPVPLYIQHVAERSAHWRMPVMVADARGTCVDCASDCHARAMLSNAYNLTWTGMHAAAGAAGGIP